jgi:hypothetical protein
VSAAKYRKAVHETSSFLVMSWEVRITKIIKGFNTISSSFSFLTSFPCLSHFLNDLSSISFTAMY